MVDEGVAREVINRIQKLRKKVRMHNDDSPLNPSLAVFNLGKTPYQFRTLRINEGNNRSNVTKRICRAHLYSSGITPPSVYLPFSSLLGSGSFAFPRLGELLFGEEKKEQHFFHSRITCAWSRADLISLITQSTRRHMLLFDVLWKSGK